MGGERRWGVGMCWAVLSGCWDVLGGVVWMLTGGGSCEEGDSVAASVERALTHPVFPPRVLSMFILSFVLVLFTQAWRSNLLLLNKCAKSESPQCSTGLQGDLLSIQKTEGRKCFMS